MTKLLSGKTIVLTGGAQGIGLAMAVALAKEQANVFVCDIAQESINQAQNRIASELGSIPIFFTLCDVTKPQEVKAWFQQIYIQTKRIDILINNAAYVQWEPVEKMHVENAIRTMEVGYHGMLYCLYEALPIMKQQGAGHIINVGSAASKILVGGTSATYSATKAAMETYSLALKNELCKTPIHVTLLRLGTVAGTNFFKEHVPSSKLPRFADWFPYLTPPQIATQVLRLVTSDKPKPIVDIPSYLPLVYLCFFLFPNMFRSIINLTGTSQREYGRIQWKL